jgi:hypothetical protein
MHGPHPHRAAGNADSAPTVDDDTMRARATAVGTRASTHTVPAFLVDRMRDARRARYTQLKL